MAALVTAIRMIPGVLSVDVHVSDPLPEFVAHERLKAKLRDGLAELLDTL